MKNKILVATHKKYTFLEQSIYIPIQVGSELSNNNFGYVMDNIGVNISYKNNTFCELTAMYWAWKNDFFKDSCFCGLVHYRRYFKGRGERLKGKRVLKESEIIAYLKEYDILLPKKRHYYIETVASHYSHAHYQKDLALTRAILEKQSNDYVATFDLVLQSRSLYLFNMFVMSPKHFEAYMSWLFPILFNLENQIDTTSYGSYQKRVFGYIAERLFNVWILKNNLRIKTIAIQHLEGENYLLKAWGVLKRKIVPQSN